MEEGASEGVGSAGVVLGHSVGHVWSTSSGWAGGEVVVCRPARGLAALVWGEATTVGAALSTLTGRTAATDELSLGAGGLGTGEEGGRGVA